MTDSIGDLFSSASQMSASSVLSAVSQAGAVMAVVGAVTGNKDLMNIGGTMSVVSGVGSLAVDAYNGTTTPTATASAPSLPDTSSAATPDMSSVGADQAASTTQSTMGDTAASASPSLDAQPMNNPSAFTASADQQPAAAATTAAPTAAPAAADQGTTPAATGVQDVSTPASAGVNTPAGVAGTVNNPSAWTAGSGQTVANNLLGSQKTDSTSFFNSLSDIWNGLNSKDKMDFAGKTLTGIATGYQADKNYQLNKDRMGILQQQMNNGKSTATYNYSNKAK